MKIINLGAKLDDNDNEVSDNEVNSIMMLFK